jgi:hypothetical protein
MLHLLGNSAGVDDCRANGLLSMLHCVGQQVVRQLIALQLDARRYPGSLIFRSQCYFETMHSIGLAWWWHPPASCWDVAQG